MCFLPYYESEVIVKEEKKMVLLIVTIILTVLTFLAGLFMVIYQVTEKNKSKSVFLLLPLCGVWFVLLLFGSFAKVGANEVGIIYHDKYGVLEEVKSEGFQKKSIYEHITRISTSNRTAEVSLAGQTKDSIYAVFEITITYRIDSVNAGKFFKVTNSTDISKDQLNSVVKAELQASAIKYDIYGILGKDLEALRVEFTTGLEEILMEKFFVTLVNTSLNDIDAGADIEKIIQNKAQAIQQVEIAEQEKLRAEVEAQTALIKAQNEADIEVLRAESKAKAEELLQSIAVNAIQTMYNSQFMDDAQARLDFETSSIGGYLTIQEIGEIVLKQLYYDNWDGALPTVITDGTGIIINP